MSDHGHFIHDRDSNNCEACYLTESLPYDIALNVERVGGGAAPIGYVVYERDNNTTLVEDWKEEDCFLRLITALILDRDLPDFDLRPLNTHKMFVFEEPYMRAWFAHDLDDVISAIDLPGGMLS